MIDVTDSNVGEYLESAELPVLLYVWAPWCGPCKMVGPALERLQNKVPGRILVAKANMEHFEQSAARFEIRATPTLILFRGGEELCRRSGALMESQISQWLDQNIGG